MTKGRTDQRSQLFIKRQFQQSLILETLLVMFILINVMVTACYFLIDSISDIQTLKHYMAYTVTGLEVIGFIVFYRINLRSSHRVAGPVFVIERCLKAIQRGDLSFTMHLRKHDQFHEVKDQMNDTVAVLKNQLSSAQALTSRIKAEGASPELIEELQKAVGYFQTKPEEVAPVADAKGEAGES